MAQTRLGALKTAANRASIPFDEYMKHIEKGEKWCYKCKSWKPLDGFGIDISRGDGRGALCLDCRRVKVRKNMKGRPSPFKGNTV